MLSVVWSPACGVGMHDMRWGHKIEIARIVQVLDVLIALLKPRLATERWTRQDGTQHVDASQELDSSIKQVAVQVLP